MFDPDSILRKVTRPARYTGGEWNSIRKGWNAVDTRVVLAYPDAYEIGMSNMGMAILYDLLNQQNGVLAERVYAPWIDMAARMREATIPLFSLETKRPISEFDIVGFHLGYELTYTNLLNMLDLAGIPLLASDRNDSMPLIIAGGSCASNPEPMADFIDLFVIGDGEEVILELIEAFSRWKKDGAGSRSELLGALARLQGVYVPTFYRVEYDADGRFDSITPQIREAKARIERRILHLLPPPLINPVVPFIEVTHDRGAVEIQRGCTRGCRFCQASVLYRPVRERPVAEVMEAVEGLVASCGYEEISLLSLSTSDYSGIGELVTSLSDEYRGTHLNISLPSLRPDAFSVELANSIQGQRKSSLTFAPEAGTDRLRCVINKGVSEDDLLRTVELAFRRGWRSFKLYFMIGLPTETPDDIAGIVELVRKVRQIKGKDGKRPNIRVNVSTFIPKPHTPFQWAGQITESDLAPKHQILKYGIRKTESKLSWHDPKTSMLEGVMSRGDRRLGKVIHRAWQLGCGFDAWSDLFDFQKWMQAFDECSIDPADYTRERFLGEALPWDHIDSGVSTDFLKQEYKRAREGEVTPDCRFGICTGCGLQLRDEGCKGKH